MATTVSMFPKGTTMTRLILAQCHAKGDPIGAAEYAAQRWGAHSPAARILKDAVVGGTTLAGSGHDVLAAYEAAQAEFVELLRPATIIGRLTGLRRVPLATRVVAATGGSTAYWVGQGKAKPISKLALLGMTLPPLKVSGLIVVTDEVIRSSDPAAEPLLRNDLVGAVAELLDASFVDPTNAGVADESPASITYGVNTLTSTGNPAEDLRHLIENFEGDLARSYLLMHPRTATEFALARDAAGSFNFPDVGPRGGSVLNIPVLTSKGVPWASAGGAIVLVDPGAIVVGDAGVELSRSSQASIEMDDAPGGDAAAGTGAATVSLWQTNSHAIKADRFVNWLVAADGAVGLIGDANYTAPEVTP